MPEPQPSIATKRERRPARERLLETAYAMFAARGVRDVGVDEVIERADVAKATLYRHFPSKDDLVVAFLEEREQRWTVDWVEAEARGRGPAAARDLRSLRRVVSSPGLEGCAFINVMLEMGLAHPAGSERASSREHPRSGRRLAEEAGFAIQPRSRARGTS